MSMQEALDAMRAFETGPSAGTLARLQEVAVGEAYEDLQCHDEWPGWVERNKQTILQLKQSARNEEADAATAAAERFNADNRKSIEEMHARIGDERRRERESEANQAGE